jgi:hypothetical protein
VDDDDAPLVSGLKWIAQRGKAGTWYATRKPWNGPKQYMHRLILGAGKGDGRIDHHNGNGLDNRRENLRRCTNAENMWNVQHGRGLSQFKGVSAHPHTPGRWRAYIVKGAKQHHLGYFDSEREAADAYDRAALKMFGAFAKLNHGGDVQQVPTVA